MIGNEIILTKRTILAASIIVAGLNLLTTLVDAEGYKKYIVIISALILSGLSILLIWISLNVAYFHIAPRIIKLKDLMKQDYKGKLTLAPSYLVEVEAEPLLKTPLLKRIIVTHSYHINIAEITYRGQSILDKCKCESPQSMCSCDMQEKRDGEPEFPIVRPDSEITIEYEIDQEKLEQSSSKVYFEIEIHEIILSIKNISIIFRLKYRVTT